MKDLKVYLINPRGFCAGVTRAIDIVEKSLEKFGGNHENPIYIRHEIVHNKTVISDLQNKGVRFVKELNEIPKNAVTIFSAHGVSEKVENHAIENAMQYIDATCPLVKKIHREGISYHEKGYYIILIGHKGHPELEGTFGRIKNNITIVETPEDAQNVSVPAYMPLCYITQTTLSLDDTSDVVNVLKNRFPNIEGLAEKNICYATANRQNAIKSIINNIDALIVVGSSNSSNSKRLKELGEKHNKPSFLIDNKNDIPFEQLNLCKTIAISAGASAPEKTVQEIMQSLGEVFNLKSEEYEYVKEDVHFHLPKLLRN